MDPSEYCDCKTANHWVVEHDYRDFEDAWSGRIQRTAVASTISCGACYRPVHPDAARVPQPYYQEPEEGSKCGDCDRGRFYYPPVKDCSCHICPPCSQCTDNELACDWCEEPTPANIKIMNEEDADYRKRKYVCEALF